MILTTSVPGADRDNCMMVVVVMMLQQHLCAQVVVDADSKDEDADDGEEDFDALPASLSRFCGEG